MEHAEIESDLLKAAAWHEQHGRTLRQMGGEAWSGAPGSGLGGEPGRRKRAGERSARARPEGAQAAAPVPLLAVAEEGDLASHGVSRRRSGTGAPCRYARPRRFRRFPAP